MALQLVSILILMLVKKIVQSDSIDDLAYDYDCDRLKIEEAIRCELPKSA